MLLRLLIGLTCVLFWMSSASAHSVTVDPAGYSGDWYLNGRHTGIQEVDLPSGTYSLKFGYYGAVSITVETDGTITSAQTNSVTTNGNTLTFKTVEIQVDPGDYAGSWIFTRGVTTRQSGSQTVTLVPDLSYEVGLGYYGRFRVFVEADGTITSTQTGSVTTNGNTLTFKTVEIQVDPGDYTGSWIFTANVHPWDSGSQTVTLVPDLSYEVGLGYYGRFRVFVEADGTITSTQTGSVTTNGNTLTFKTVEIQVDPGDYTGSWIFTANVHPWDSGSQTVTLVPDLSYEVGLGYYGRFRVFVEADGTITSTQTGSVTTNGNTLTFKTVEIQVDPGDYTGSWIFTANVHPWDSGSQTVTLVPDLSYEFSVGSYGRFQVFVEADGSVTTNNTDATSVNSNTMTLLSASVLIEVGDYQGDWWLSYITGHQSGGNTVNLVPGLRYLLKTDLGSAFFNVLAPCEIDPQVVQIGDHEFPLSCGQPPIANAGEDQNFVITGEETEVVLDGNASSDPDGDEITLKWMLDLEVIGEGLSPTVDLPVGVHTIVVIVDDGKGGSDTDEVVITITAIPSDVSLFASKDNFLRNGVKNSNEGANLHLRIRQDGKNRGIVAFDISDIEGIPTKATLVFTIADIGNNWSSAGRMVDAYYLPQQFAEGNGVNSIVAIANRSRGEGTGATWNSSNDLDISNKKPDAVSEWNGGSDVISSTPTDSVLHTNELSGEVTYDITSDLLGALANQENEVGWLLKKAEEGQSGRVEYYSREGSLENSNPDLAPRLIISFTPSE